jgi:ADP-ribose pyrophosphatase
MLEASATYEVPMALSRPQDGEVTRQSIHRGRVVDLGLERLTLPNGHRAELEIVRHPGGAAIVALDSHSHICLIRQFRHAAGGWVWELPAGKLEPDEDPLAAAQRELAEEAGISARDWTALGRIVTSPGFCDEVIHLYQARTLSQVEPRPEQHEVLEVHWVSAQQARTWMVDGTLSDAKTLIGLYWILCPDGFAPT